DGIKPNSVLGVNVVRGNDVRNANTGILCTNVAQLEVSGNTVRDTVGRGLHLIYNSTTYIDNTLKLIGLTVTGNRVVNWGKDGVSSRVGMELAISSLSADTYKGVRISGNTFEQLTGSTAHASAPSD